MAQTTGFGRRTFIRGTGAAGAAVALQALMAGTAGAQPGSPGQGPGVLQSPDNITVSPRTNGLVLCEDGSGKDLIRGVTTRGEIFDFCEFNGPNDSEWAGATFSPDGRVLFFNLQSPGVSYAVTGPWERGAL